MNSGIENDLKIHPKNLLRTGCSTSGDTLGSFREPPGVQDVEIEDFGDRFESIFEVRRSKIGPKSMPRASQKLIPTYIIELDEPDRLR